MKKCNLCYEIRIFDMTRLNTKEHSSFLITQNNDNNSVFFIVG